MSLKSPNESPEPEATYEPTVVEYKPSIVDVVEESPSINDPEYTESFDSNEANDQENTEPFLFHEALSQEQTNESTDLEPASVAETSGEETGEFTIPVSPQANDQPASVSERSIDPIQSTVALPDQNLSKSVSGEEQSPQKEGVEVVEETFEEGSTIPSNGVPFVIDSEPRHEDIPVVEQNGDPHQFDSVHTVKFVSSESELQNLPNGSVLFVGNLPLDYNDKHELAQVFAKYGDILNISFEQGKRTGHGLIQFRTPEVCKRAIKGEDRRLMKGGFKLDLQDNYERSLRNAPPIEDVRKGVRERQKKAKVEKKRDRDPSPPRRDQRSKRDRSPDRRPRRVPDVQIIIIGEVENRFVSRVENKIRSQNLHFDVFHLRATMDLALKVQQFNQDGISAIMFLEPNQAKNNTVSLQISNPNGRLTGNAMFTIEFDRISMDEACRQVYLAKDKGKRVPLPINPAVVLNPMNTILQLASQQNLALDPNLLLQLMAGQIPMPLPSNSGLPVNQHASIMGSQQRPPMPVMNQFGGMQGGQSAYDPNTLNQHSQMASMGQPQMNNLGQSQTHLAQSQLPTLNQAQMANYSQSQMANMSQSQLSSLAQQLPNMSQSQLSSLAQQMPNMNQSQMNNMNQSQIQALNQSQIPNLGYQAQNIANMLSQLNANANMLESLKNLRK